MVRLGNIGAGHFKDSDSAYIPHEYFRELQRHEIKTGDLLIAGLGDERNPVGRACIAPTNLGPAIVKADCFRARLDQSRMTHRFAAWALSSSFITDQVATLSRGSTRTRINLDIARHIQIPVPDIEEQRRIADFLDAATSRLDRLARRRVYQAALLSAYHRSWLSEEWESLVKEFGKARLRHLVTSLEQGWSPQCEERVVEDDGWGVVKAGCVNTGVFDPNQHKALPANMEPRREYKLEVGDLLVSRASGSPDLIGSTAVVDQLTGKLLLCDKIYRLKVDKTKALPWFVAFMLRSQAAREHIKRGISGAEGMANNLPTSIVKDCQIPNAPLRKQDHVVRKATEHRDSIEKTRSALQEASRLISERRQALITAAVTGQIDVSTASGQAE
ncbi:restriction endonuclease subunit S [Micromonospora sagamiensis]|uniref:restriction endonuclease subunit S n=1 Tax=Micromonospora sagamiensis TaxID=47875 RepID=UPI0016471794|nr:restriction endonuclease subunit S [Micromonospora sagamiensis]